MLNFYVMNHNISLVYKTAFVTFTMFWAQHCSSKTNSIYEQIIVKLHKTFKWYMPYNSHDSDKSICPSFSLPMMYSGVILQSRLYSRNEKQERYKKPRFPVEFLCHSNSSRFHQSEN